MRVPKRPEALNLLDLRRKSKTVQVDPDDPEHIAEVYALSSEDIAYLMEHHESLNRFLLAQGLTREMILGQVPTTICAIIAAGFGHTGDEAYEAAAADLSIETQAELVDAIFQCTFTRGFGPFVSRIQAMGLQPTTGPVGRAQDSRSPKPSPTTKEPTEAPAGDSPPASSPPTTTSPIDAEASTQEPPSS